MSRHHWTAAEIEIMRAAYPDTPTAALAATLGLSVKQVQAKAGALALRKSAAYLAGPHACRLRRGGDIGVRSRFQPGQTAWNKGSHYVAGGRSAETRFKPGRPACEARNYQPIGSLRLNKDGYLERKVTDDPALAPVRRWVGVHRLVWEAAHGPIPPRHVVRFLPGQRTVVAEEITVERLELVSQAENMRRNTVHRYPPQIAQAVQLLGALNRIINNRSTNSEHHE